MRTFVLKIITLSLTLFLFRPFSVHAAPSPEALETKALQIEKKLMAPCCWGSVIGEHSSQEAVQMKSEIRTVLNEGQSEKDILKHYADKYGERVLAQPTAQGFNFLVWMMPFLMAIAGIGALYYILRRFFLSKETTRLNHEGVLTARPAHTASTEEDKKYYAQINKEMSEL